uniref:Tetratricopeptide repeat protein 8 n=1 Tax=Clastoptera arizonana TaxID=38151 RepID=A0A1B6EGE7_9HEMI
MLLLFKLPDSILPNMPQIKDLQNLCFNLYFIMKIMSVIILEALNKIPASVIYYRQILQKDATNIESIACIAVNYFYNDQPEIALRFYRRLLQMGLYNAELFNNLGLCCFYCQQYDMSVSCFERALSLAVDVTAADVWFNIGNVFIAAASIAPHLYEADYNNALISHDVGDLQTSYIVLQKALKAYPEHQMSVEIMKELQKHFNHF